MSVIVMFVKKYWLAIIAAVILWLVVGFAAIGGAPSLADCLTQNCGHDSLKEWTIIAWGSFACGVVLLCLVTLLVPPMERLERWLRRSKN